MIKLYSQHKNYNREGFPPEAIAKLLPKCIARGKTKEEINTKYKDKFDTTKEHNNVLIIKEDVDKWAMYTAKEGHASVFYYPDDAFKKKESNNKAIEGVLDTANYTGSVYTDWYYFDGDLENDIPGCITAISELLIYLHTNKLFHLLFFSGQKGFHLYIPISLIEVPEKLKGRADLVCRYFLDQLIKQFPALNKIKDTQVYSRNHLFRLPWSSHDKTNKIKRLYEWVGKEGNENNPTKWIKKVPITINSMETINNILSKPMNLKPHWKLEIQKKLPVNKKPKTLFDFNTPYMGKVCIFEMLKDPDPKAKGLSRHYVSLTLLAYWYEQHVPESIAWEHLLWWNNEVLNDSLPLKELKGKMTSWGTITPGCNYITKATYCPKNNTCPHFKNIESGEKAYDSDNAAEAYANSLVESTENYVRLDRVFKNLTFTLKPSRGHIVTLIADSGVGKTILAMLIMLYCTHIHWLFNSYEQGKPIIQCGLIFYECPLYQ